MVSTETSIKSITTEVRNKLLELPNLVCTVINDESSIHIKGTALGSDSPYNESIESMLTIIHKIVADHELAMQFSICSCRYDLKLSRIH